VWLVQDVSVVHAQPPNEFQVKAAYLFNFGKYVEWPVRTTAAPNDSFPICVFGRDPFGSVLDSTFVNERIEGKSVLPRRISRPADAINCRILFISSSSSASLKEILTVVDKAGILTVSDIPQFSRHGGIIEFVLEGSKVRFEINVATAESAGLKISSELLKVARTVRVAP
jgi:hypothetical protein